MPKPKKPFIWLTCMACGEEHETRRHGATACRSCLDAGRRPNTRKCRSCRQKYPSAHGGIFCKTCEPDRSDIELGVTYQKALEDERQKALEDKLLEQDKEERHLRRVQKRREMVAQQLEILEKLGKKPKGLPEMTKDIAAGTIAVLWLQLCGSDGSVNPLLRDQVVEDETKQRMLTTYLRLRLKGYTGDALSKVDPVALMAKDAEDIDKALTELPKVEDDDDDTATAFDPLEDLDPAMREWVNDFQFNQDQQQQAERLGLSTTTTTNN